MLISDKNKFIFIHIFKTAGTSITKYFLPYSNIKYRYAYGNWFTRKIFGQLFKVIGDGGESLLGHHKHSTANQIKLSIGAKYDHYFKFAFVRNPYDRALSAYYYFMQSPWLPLHKEACEKKIHEFLGVYLQTRPFRQVDYLCDNNNNIMVDYIGRYENINEDLEHVLDELGIEKRGILERHNVSKRKRKNVFDVMNEENILMINDYFKNDFELFGYKMKEK